MWARFAFVCRLPLTRELLSRWLFGADWMQGGSRNLCYRVAIVCRRGLRLCPGVRWLKLSTAAGYPAGSSTEPMRTGMWRNLEGGSRQRYFAATSSAPWEGLAFARAVVCRARSSVVER